MVDWNRELSGILADIALINKHSTDPAAKRRYHVREYLADRGVKMPVEMRAKSIDSFFGILEMLDRVPSSDEKDAVRGTIECYIISNLNAMVEYNDVVTSDDAFLPHERRAVTCVVDVYKRRVGEYLAREPSRADKNHS